MKHDIVYILKNNIDDEELIYSVRSVVKNFPYHRLWFAGGKPKHIKPDYYIPIIQKGNNKWEKVTNTIKVICHNHTITENFWLFNDDFFVMQPVTDLKPALDGTILKLIKEINKKYNNFTPYTTELFKTKKELEKKGYRTRNYALHIPMLINREKAYKTIQTFPDNYMFRSLYGNHHSIEGIQTSDVKILDLEKEPTGKEIFLSTSDKSFKHGKVGKYIKAQFPERCKYEI